jgi:GH24 family phage-related lysozyme (muramidase)
LLQFLNAGDYAGASAEFSKWIHVNNLPNQQLVSRRAADASMFV